MVSQSTRQAGPVTLMLLTLLLLIPTTLFAETACEAAEQTLLELQRELQQLRRDRLQWQSLLNGQVPAPHQLDALLGQPLDTPLIGTARKPAPREAIQSHCPARQDDITATLEQLSKLDRQLYAQRMALLDLPLQQRRAFFALSRLHASLQTVLDKPGSSPGIRHDAQQLQAHITRVWSLLGNMDNTPGDALTTLDQAWYHTPALMPPSTDTPAYRDLIHLRLELQKQIRTLRSELWQQSALPSLIRDQGGLTSVPELLAREVRQLGQRLRDTASLIRHDLSGPARKTRYAPLAQNILALMLGTACFVLLVKLARRSRGWALAAHDKVVSASGERRWLRNASRLISGLAPMLPWLLLWFILEQLNPLLNTPATKVLHWLLPFAYLYVFYGLLCLVGEWLIGRVAQSAGSYLSSEQTREILAHSHATARWLMVPWFPVLVVWESLGPSLLYYLLLGLLMVSLFRGLGHLLVLRREDYLLCLQALLPSYLDPVAEKLLAPALFWLFAPLLLPLALVSFLVGFVDRVLTDFDWYKRLQARWFRLRTRTPSEDKEARKQDQESAREHYEQWFAKTLPEDSKHPFIDTGLVAAMEKHVQRWHEDKTDENALVVTGEKGSGKSMSLTRLEKTLGDSCPDLEVVTLKVPAKSSDPEQIMALIGDALDTDLSKHGPAALVKTDENRKPVLVILDEAQHFFLARQGGLEGWRSILSLVNSKLDNVFWLLTINNQSWAYLCNVFGREYQFRNVVRVKPWGQSDIRSLILSRNHLSGYQVRYDEVLLSSRGPEAGNVRNAEQRYFSLLWDACRGNPLVALRLWITSVKVNGRQVTVGLPTPPSASVLDTMGENALFVYAAIATHGDLSSHEISEVTCLAENVVRYALKGGLDAGFLRRSDDARYRIVPLWYQPVISYLTRKNLLNE